MSGIVGIYYTDKKTIVPEKLTKMVDILAHRGPDGAKIWCHENVGLGHRMLHTTPESLLERQPLVNHFGNLVLTADARIDNRNELISSLQLQDIPAEKITDSQLILHAYKKWEETSPEKLLGDFAFAIWDSQKQQIFAARDHFGVKPFYYYFDSSDAIFAFASEIKAIFCLPEIPRVVNEERIGDYLIGNFDDLTMTSYQNILRLPPASRMTVSHKSIEVEKYWSLDISKETHLGSDEEYAARFLAIFTEAVRCRTRSCSNIGSMLSGGLDSSSITCLARKLLPKKQQLPTFSAIFKQVSECDERQFIDKVLERDGYQPHFLYGDLRTPLTDINEIFWHEDEAFYAPGLAVMTWGICELARDRGVSVLLGGYDGDSTVSYGLGYFHELAQAGHWLKLFQEIQGLAKIHQESAWLGFVGFGSYFYGYVLRRTKLFKFFRKIHSKLRKVVKGQGNAQSWLKRNLNPDFVQRIDLEQRKLQLEKAGNIAKYSSKARHYRGLTHGLHPFALEVFDKAAAAFSLELRYPFWDKRLVEFCLSLPPEQKLSQGWSRLVMRRAMQDILPSEIQWRTDKIDFLPNLIYGLLTQEKQTLKRLIFQDLEILNGYINIDNLQKLYEKNLSQKSQADPKEVNFIWHATCLGLWLNFVANNSFSEPEATNL